MISLPTNRDDSDGEEQEGAAAVWAFLLVLFFFKLATVIARSRGRTTCVCIARHNAAIVTLVVEADAMAASGAD